MKFLFLLVLISSARCVYVLYYSEHALAEKVNYSLSRGDVSLKNYIKAKDLFTRFPSRFEFNQLATEFSREGLPPISGLKTGFAEHKIDEEINRLVVTNNWLELSDDQNYDLYKKIYPGNSAIEQVENYLNHGKVITDKTLQLIVGQSISRSCRQAAPLVLRFLRAEDLKASLTADGLCLEFLVEIASGEYEKALARLTNTDLQVTLNDNLFSQRAGYLKKKIATMEPDSHGFLALLNEVVLLDPFDKEALNDLITFQK